MRRALLVSLGLHVLGLVLAGVAVRPRFAVPPRLQQIPVDFIALAAPAPALTERAGPSVERSPELAGPARDESVTPPRQPSQRRSVEPPRRRAEPPRQRPEPSRPYPRREESVRQEPKREEPMRREPQRQEPKRAESSRAELNRAEPKPGEPRRDEARPAASNRPEPGRPAPGPAGPGRDVPPREGPRREPGPKPPPNLPRQGRADTTVVMRSELPQVGDLRGAMQMRVDGEVLPYTYYLSIVQRKVASFWELPAGIEDRPGEVAAIVWLRIEKDGAVRSSYCEAPSGVNPFDACALRAVARALPLPRLPEDYPGDHLIIHLRFVYSHGASAPAEVP